MVAQASGKVLYVSGEESTRQIKLRAERLGVSATDLHLLAETDLEHIFEQTQSLQPILLVIDSIQTHPRRGIGFVTGFALPGARVRYSLADTCEVNWHQRLDDWPRDKDGSIAGPRVLEHIVDAVLYLEGDPFQQYRLLRGVKNRFGATSEVGVFEMRGSGLVQVENPSEAFLEERVINAPGSRDRDNYGRHPSLAR